MLPKFSIITPSFNQKKYIEDNIISVINQDYDNIEHIIIDGGSSDGILDIFKKYKNLKWISEKVSGPSHSKNYLRYNITFKYFNSIGILSSIFLSPLWSAYTHAFESKDYAWIENVIKKNLRFFDVVCVLVVLMILVSNYFYTFWIGKEIIIPFKLTILIDFIKIDVEGAEKLIF